MHVPIGVVFISDEPTPTGSMSRRRACRAVVTVDSGNLAQRHGHQGRQDDDRSKVAHRYRPRLWPTRAVATTRALVRRRPDRLPTDTRGAPEDG
jgi:hypothetical protein